MSWRQEAESCGSITRRTPLMALARNPIHWATTVTCIGPPSTTAPPARLLEHAVERRPVAGLDRRAHRYGVLSDGLRHRPGYPEPPEDVKTAETVIPSRRWQHVRMGIEDYMNLLMPACT